VITPDGVPVRARPVDTRPDDEVPVDVVVARPMGAETLAAAAARAAATTSGDLICFLLASTSTIDAGWLARLAAAIDGATVIVAVAAAIAIDPRPVGSRAALTTPIPAHTRVWRTYVEEHGPELMRQASPLAEGRLRIALTVAAPSQKVAPRWGDWHLAQAFAR